MGHFQKNLPLAKLKMLPHRRSRCTGMMGTSSAVDDLFHAALEGQHVAGAADGAFGEDADDVAGGEFAARGADGFHHVAGAAGAHRNGIRAAQQPVEGFHLVDRASTP